MAVTFFYQSLLKVEMGSAMYKTGIRWTESLVYQGVLDPYDIDKSHLVPENILTISKIILMVFKITVSVVITQ